MATTNNPPVPLVYAQEGDRVSGSISFSVRTGGRDGWVKAEASIEIAPGEHYNDAVVRLASSCAEALPALHEELITAIKETS